MLISNQIQILREFAPGRLESLLILSAQIKELRDAISGRGYPFAMGFQIEALWVNAILSPNEIRILLPEIESIYNRSGSNNLVAALRFLQTQLPAAGPGVNPSAAGVQQARRILSQYADMAYPEKDLGQSAEILVHRATVTPTGVYLYGPERETPNRVIRQYAGHEDCFIRISFTDESGGKIQFDPETSNERILQDRFLSILRQGLVIAGHRFEFWDSHTPHSEHRHVGLCARLFFSDQR